MYVISLNKYHYWNYVYDIPLLTIINGIVIQEIQIQKNL